MSDFEDVGRFHERFDLPHVSGDRPTPHLISRELADFRINFLFEELKELVSAYDADDLPRIADALVDIVYVALGTAHYHDLPWAHIFSAVQHANMQKVRALRAEDSARGSTFDVVKPEGWTPPNLEAILLAYGWAPQGPEKK